MSNPIVLVHGAYHGAWCWDKVVGCLAPHRQVLALDMPALSDTYEQAEVVKLALNKINQPVILVGHSYGGRIITEAVDDISQVQHLVYLAAVVPELGVSAPVNLGEDWAYYDTVVDNGDGIYSLDPKKTPYVFFHDCSDDDVSWAMKELRPQRFSNEQAIRRIPWKDIESTYVACQNDRVVPIEIQKKWAQRCSHRITLNSGHSPMISEPQMLADILLKLSS